MFNKLQNILLQKKKDRLKKQADNLLEESKSLLKEFKPGEYTSLIPRNIILSRVVNILHEISTVEIEEIHPYSDLFYDLGLDYLDFIEITQSIEERVTFSSWGRASFSVWCLETDKLLQQQDENNYSDITMTVQDLADTLYSFEPIA